MKYSDFSWDFREADTKRFTHCYHSYPAMMIPQIAERLLIKYGMNSKILFDPYCGTGTSLVEANLKNIHAIGTDINPLARLIAKAKTTLVNTQLLDLYLKDFNDFAFQFRFGITRNYSVVLPQFSNIDFWFNKRTQHKLAIIKSFIDNIKDDHVRMFFLVAFSETIRESSLTKKSEFKLVRIQKEKRDNFNPDSFGIFLSKLSRNKNGLLEYEKAKENVATSAIHSFNTVNYIPDSEIADHSMDIILTSPPYGDSRTTVAYGQYSRLSNQWMGIENANRIDELLMGGKKKNHPYSINSFLLNDTIEKIAQTDEKRAKEVFSFFVDYKKSIDNVSKKLKPRKYACYVVGNRTVKSVQIPMDEITKEFFEMNDFRHVETIIRNIPNKRMPSKNSPSNVVGDKSTTMKHEYIVIMQKN